MARLFTIDFVYNQKTYNAVVTHNGSMDEEAAYHVRISHPLLQSAVDENHLVVNRSELLEDRYSVRDVDAGFMSSLRRAIQQHLSLNNRV